MSLHKAQLAPDGRPMVRVLLRPHPVVIRGLVGRGIKPITLIGKFLVDTGADRTVIANDLASRAAMSRWIRPDSVNGVGASKADGYVYWLQYGLEVVNEQGRQGEQFWRGNVLALPRAQILGLDGLLGRDFLRYGQLLVDGVGGYFQITLPTRTLR